MPESEVQTMARNKKDKYGTYQRKTVNDNHYVALFESLMKSPAYSELSCEAKCIYNLLRLNNYGSNKMAKCPYKDMVKYAGVHKSRIKTRIDELVAFGFVKIYTEQIDLKSRTKGQPANVYEFLEDWKTITEDDTEQIKKELKERKKDNQQRKEKSYERINEMKSKQENKA